MESSAVPPEQSPSGPEGTRSTGVPTSVLGRLIEMVLETAVLSFAVWTLLYCLGLATQWSLWPSGWIWLAATVAIAVWRLLPLARDLRAPGSIAGHEAAPSAGPGPDSEPDVDTEPAVLLPERMRLTMLLGGLVLVAFSGLGGLIWTVPTFRFTWASLVVGMVLLGVWTITSGRFTRSTAAPGPVGPAVLRRWFSLEEVGVLVVMAGTAVLTSYTHLADTDDPYYLNRSVWVAQHGNAALRDTMFSPQVYNTPYGGGVPIASIESLFGVLAHLTGSLAGTITYLVAAPVAAALAVLATWRLARRWAPRRAFLVFLGAIAFLLLSGDSMLGNFWIPRIWQGKVIAVAFLMPLIWSWLTDAYEARTSTDRRWAIGLLFAAGIAFFGLTPTAVVLGPVMFAAVLLAAILLRSRPLALGGLAMVIGPVVSGLAVIAFSSGVGGTDPVALGARASFVRILGESRPMVALGLLALGLAALLARRGAGSALAGASALAGVLVFAPGVLPLLNAVTGSGPILWRMLYVAPIPVLAGLMLASPLPDRLPVGLPEVLSVQLRRPLTWAVAAVPGLAVLAGFAVGGLPVWSHTGHGGPVTLTSSPTWKVDTTALSNVRILSQHPLSGEVLLPPKAMEVLTMYSTEAYPVVPRLWFVQNIHESPGRARARHVLLQLAAGNGQLPAAKVVKHDLRLLSVTLACTGANPQSARVVDLFHEAGFVGTATYGTLTCARTPATTPS